MAENWAAPFEEAFGDFDLNKTEGIRSCRVYSHQESGGEPVVAIDLGLTYEGRGIRLVFMDVRRARVPEITSVGLQFGEPCIEKIGDGLEGIRYRMTDEIEAWLIEADNVMAEVEG